MYTLTENNMRTPLDLCYNTISCQNGCYFLNVSTFQNNKYGVSEVTSVILMKGLST